MYEMNFKSVYKFRIEDFVRMKQDLGYKFKTPHIILKGLDSLAFETNQKKIGLTKKFYLKYANCKPDESPIYHYSRMMIFRNFSIYLLDLGIPSYIPPKPKFVKNGYVPYIYTENQLAEIFKCSDNLKNTINNPSTNQYCFPVIIRLLYSTGIRSCEATSLKDEDVFLEEKYILIKNSKNGKERMLPISESLAQVLIDYADYKSTIKVKNRQNFFFVKPDGNRPSRSGIYYKFKECLQLAKIFGNDESVRPSLHDLRHTFAVNSLAQMAKDGSDLYVSLPLLSQYLGHSSVTSTDHYVRLTAIMFPDLLDKINLLTWDIFPKTIKNE